MVAKETSAASVLNAKREEDLKKYREAATVRREHLLKRQKKAVLEMSPRIAILGARTEPDSTSRIRTEKLLGYGVEVVPVKPDSESYLGLSTYDSIGGIPGDVDIVQVYPSDEIDLPRIARETVEKGCVKAFWVEEDEVSLEVKDILDGGRVQVVEHESLEREYSKHFPFFGPEHVKTEAGKRVTVGERMTHRPVTVKSGEGLREAMEKMKRGRFRHLPVVDDEGRLTGMLSDRDIRLIRPSRTFVSRERAATQMLSTSVEQAAVFDPVTIHPEVSLEEAARLMLRWEIGGLPVVSKGKVLVGIITYTDLLREFVVRGV